MTRFRFAATAALIATIALGATAADASAPAVPKALASLTAAEQSYVTTMRSLDAAYFNEPMTDADYVRGGRGFCENELKAGMTWSSLRATLEENGLSDFYRYFRTSIQAAAGAFCPERLPIKN